MELEQNVVSSSSKEPYKYSKIKDLTVGTVHNIYGVVKSFTGPNVSISGWKVLSIWMVDESCAEGEDQRDCLPCVLFGSDKVRLPEIIVGDILRFHRLKVSNYKGCAQGKEGPGFSWLVASGDNIEHSHDNATFTPVDEKRIHELKDWRDKFAVFKHSADITQISDIEHKDYWVNLTVQLVAVYQSENDSTCAILVVWDGTVPSFMSHSYCTMDRQVGKPDVNLENISCRKTIKIHCYDNHNYDACQLVSGQFVKLVNVHVKVIDAAAIRNAVSMGILNAKEVEHNSTWLSLVMHKGNANGRRVVTLQETDDEYNELHRLLIENADIEESQSILNSSYNTKINAIDDSESSQERDDNGGEILSCFADDILALEKARQFFEMYPHIEHEVLLNQQEVDSIQHEATED